MDLESILEECEAIQAIYCGENESTTLVQDGDDTVHLYVTIVPSTCPAPVRVTVTVIVLQYPDEGPCIRVQSEDGPSGIDMRPLQDHLQGVALSNLGSPMLLTLITEVSTWPYTGTSQEGAVLEGGAIDGAERKVDAGPSEVCGGLDATTSSPKDSSTDSQLCVLSLQHMRSKGPYLRTMARWCQQLGLVARVMFIRRTILVLLIGDQDGIKKYIQRNRTEIVDVDSKGRGCKERLLSVLHTVRLVNPKDNNSTNISASRSGGSGIYDMNTSDNRVKSRRTRDACEKQDKGVGKGNEEDCVIFDVDEVEETFKLIEVESKQDLEEKLREDGMENLAKLIIRFV